MECLTKLQSKYQLKEIYLNYRNYHLVFIKVADLDPLLDQISDPDEIPFWAEIWPAAIGLAEFIIDHQSWFTGKTVLELGAGVGVAGIAAKLVGATVTQSDFLEDAFHFIRINSLRNGVEPGPFLLADWRKFPLEFGRFDAIIGSDILYEKTLHTNLLQIFRQTLKPEGTIWLADPGRDFGIQFINEMIVKDFRKTQLQIPLFYEERTYNIDIYQLKPAGNRAEAISL